MNNTDKVYPQVDDVPEQVYNDWLYNMDDQLVRALLLLEETNKLWIIQTMSPRIEVAKL